MFWPCADCKSEVWGRLGQQFGKKGKRKIYCRDCAIKRGGK